MIHQSPGKLLDQERQDAYAAATGITHAEIASFLRRYRWTLIGSIILSVALAIVYVNTTTPLFTARAQILMDPKMPQIPSREQNGDPSASMDTALVESQMVVMRSEKIMTAVIHTLRLEDNLTPTFGWRTILGSLTSWLFPPDPAPPTAYERSRQAIGVMEAGLSIRRIGSSYAFEIAYSSPDPELAARVVNAITDAYVRDQLDSRAESARQGSEWLEGRIVQLRRQMNAASKLVQEFRASHDYRIYGRRGGASAEPPKGPDVQDKDEAITLEELESAAQTNRKIYESFLQAYAEAVQRQSFPLAGARVITAATRPLHRSHPRTVLILALAVLLGAIAGSAVAAVRRMRDTTIRSVQQLRSDAKPSCVVEVSRIRTLSAEPRTVRTARRAAGSRFVETTVAPFSAFSDELRRVSAFLTRGSKGKRPRCIGIVSALSGDGRSTVASNLAALFSSSGTRALIVDADIRNPALTHRFAPDATSGLVDVLTGSVAVETAICGTGHPCLDLLPSPPGSSVAHASDLLGSDGLRHLLDRLAATYDVIILDLPPTSVVEDALAAGPLLDGVVVVAGWGRTPYGAFSELVHGLDASQTRILATILNMAEPRPSTERAPGYSAPWVRLASSRASA